VNRTTIFCLVVSLIAVDFFTKLVIDTPDWAWHYREPGWRWSAMAALVVVAPLMLWKPLAIPAALFFAGVAGNLLSSVRGDVANPFVIDRGTSLVAFNFADVVLISAFAALVVSSPWVARAVVTEARRAVA
jgi:hypothetical protein